jgi:nucleotide-binding universal stress UspA family protein
MVHTCPRCGLKFSFDAELVEHIEVDHHADPSQFDRLKYSPKAQRPPGVRYLVVANRTAGEKALFDHLRSLSDATTAHFHVVVPATPSEGEPHRPDDKGLALASYRARHLAEQLAQAGIEAEVEVGDPDPIKAVAVAIDHEPADRIIVSTLPEGISHWLRVGLPARLERSFKLPVDVVTASG